VETDIPILKDIQSMKVCIDKILITCFTVGAPAGPGVTHGYVHGCGQSLIVDSWRVYSVSSIKPWYILASFLGIYFESWG
jgi:hypothetical protein